MSLHPAPVATGTGADNRDTAAHGQRTVTAALRVMGLADDGHFVNYHRVCP
jgi:hypothetical protein